MPANVAMVSEASRCYNLAMKSRMLPKDHHAAVAARLIGTAPEFDDLLKDVFGPKAIHKTHGVTDPHRRQLLCAEIDALVARLYDLTEAEFTHILGTFPLVDAATKQLTLETYRHLLRLGHFPHHNR